jgi:hypothetical protein
LDLPVTLSRYPLLDALMGLRAAVIILILSHDPTQLGGVQDEHIVEAFSPEATDKAFTYRIGSRGFDRCLQFFDAPTLR